MAAILVQSGSQQDRIFGKGKRLRGLHRYPQLIWTISVKVRFDFMTLGGVTESRVRTQLQFDDANGIFDMPINDILEGMRFIGYCICSYCYQKLDWYSYFLLWWDEIWLVQERVFVFTKVSTSPRVSSYLVKAYQIYLCCCKDWKLLFFDVATSFDYVVHRVHAVSFDACVLGFASTIVVAGYIVSAGICDAAGSFVLAVFIYIC
ncbi:hypothetical protein Tco_1029176 [Tanacetum coccineum]|uniref:Uncharacterized protein n=1 Tax=Tanacetum coccineum TaxID=301880 RepID=A0ABQ5G2P8_9ASTR